MRWKLLILTVSGGLVLAPVPTAAAHGGHTSCAAFGRDISAEAQAFRPLGQAVRTIAPVNGVVLEEHAGICG